jgi:hypothetical protein
VSSSLEDRRNSGCGTRLAWAFSRFQVGHWDASCQMRAKARFLRARSRPTEETLS